MSAFRAVLWVVFGLLPLLVLARALLEGSVLVMALVWAFWQHLSLEAAAARLLQDPLPLGMAQLFALGTASFLALRVLGARPGARRAEFWHRPARRWNERAILWLLAALLGIGLQFVLIEYSARLGEMVPLFERDPAVEEAIARLTRIDGPYRALTVPLAIAIIAPLTEELLFRGVLLLYLGAGPVTLVLSSVAFGVFHVEPVAIAYAIPAGFVLGALAMRTRSIAASIVCHATFNSVPLVLASIGYEPERIATPLLLASLVLTVFAGSSIWYMSRHTPEAGSARGPIDNGPPGRMSHRS